MAVVKGDTDAAALGVHCVEPSRKGLVSASLEQPEDFSVFPPWKLTRGESFIATLDAPFRGRVELAELTFPR